MNAIRIVSAAELRAAVRFEDLIEPVATAFRKSSAGLADNGLVVMYPLEQRDRGDVYVKTGMLAGHSVYVVKVSPWFAANVERGEAQGGFIGVFDSTTGHTIALLNEEHYLSDIRTAAAGAVAARALAPDHVRTACVLGAGVQAYWQSLALYRERAYQTLLIWARNTHRATALRDRLMQELPDVEVTVQTDLESVVRRADTLICATLSRELVRRRLRQAITARRRNDPANANSTPAIGRRAYSSTRSTPQRATATCIARSGSGRYRLGDIASEIGAFWRA